MDNQINIGGSRNYISLDRTAVYELMVTLSELHGRRCAEINDCGDMELANKLAGQLGIITVAHNELEQIAASIDKREPALLDVE
jgi:hypothetical protein